MAHAASLEKPHYNQPPTMAELGDLFDAVIASANPNTEAADQTSPSATTALDRTAHQAPSESPASSGESPDRIAPLRKLTMSRADTCGTDTGYTGLWTEDQFVSDSPQSTGLRRISGPSGNAVQASSLVDHTMLPVWINNDLSQSHHSLAPQGRSVSGFDTLSAEPRNGQDNRGARDTSRGNTNEHSAAPAASANERNNSDQPAANYLPGADSFPELPEPLATSGSPERAPASTQQHNMTAEERDTAETQNETTLRDLISRLEGDWHKINANTHHTPLRKRLDMLETAARNANLDSDGVDLLLEKPEWQNVNNDIRAMLETDQQYTRADEVTLHNLGVRLDMLIALSLKMMEMEGDFGGERPLRYAAVMSIEEVICDYLGEHLKLPPPGKPPTSLLRTVLNKGIKWLSSMMSPATPEFINSAPHSRSEGHQAGADEEWLR